MSGSTPHQSKRKIYKLFTDFHTYFPTYVHKWEKNYHHIISETNLLPSLSKLLFFVLHAYNSHIFPIPRQTQEILARIIIKTLHILES